MLEKQKFVRYELDEKKMRDTFNVSFNKEERIQLEMDKKLLNQEKDSTALKQLASIGSKVLHSSEIKEILSIVLDNKRKNKRLGINQFE